MRHFLMVCLLLAAVPAIAGDVYDNGPINGNTDAWAVSEGLVVSDQFNIMVSQDGWGMYWGAWSLPESIPQTVDWSLTSAENGGTVYQSGTASLTSTYLFHNQFGYDVYQETFMVNAPLPAGNYWINLQNATTNTGEPIWWDENSGPALASENYFGTIPSEAFTIVGNGGTTTPEPSSLLLFGSGVAGLLGLVRRCRW